MVGDIENVRMLLTTTIKKDKSHVACHAIHLIHKESELIVYVNLPVVVVTLVVVVVARIRKDID